MRRRVPLLQQSGATDCGAASLAMILNYYGYRISESEVSEQCSVGRDGINAQIIVRAAQHYGMIARVFAFNNIPDLQYVDLPAIVHWGFNHFVIVEKWSPSQITIVDAASGRKNLTVEEFSNNFTGIIILLSPGIHFQRRSKSSSISLRQYLWQMLSLPDTKKILFQVLLASFLLQGAMLTIPLITKVLVDSILLPHGINLISILGLSLAMIALMQFLTGYVRSIVLIYLQGRLDAYLSLGFFKHILSLPLPFFQERSSGDLLMRLASNQLIRDMLTNQILSIILDGAFALMYLIILILEKFDYALLVVGIGIFQVFLLLATSRKISTLIRNEIVAQAASESYLINSLAGIATIKASGAEDHILSHWTDLFHRGLNISIQQRRVSSIIDLLLGTLQNFAPLFLLLFGASAVLANQMSLGTLLALNALAIAFLSPLSSLVYAGRQFYLVNVNLERVADVLEKEPEQAGPLSSYTTVTVHGMIALDHVCFRYTSDSPLVLKDITCQIDPRQKVAIVGRSGSGKSTLALLLVGLYRPSSGKISYDGMELEQLDYHALRRQFGVVLQDPFLVNGTIRQNIAFNAPDLPIDDIMAAARLAGIHDEISQMPMGYETLISEGGFTLAGGQRQRLAIARAIAHQPKILVFDEATSHLDAVTESAISRNLDSLACTRIIIAHRLSTIRDADCILVIHDGRLVEQGTHEQLLALNQHYATLVNNQSLELSKVEC